MHGSYPESMTSSDVVDRSPGTLARLLRWALAVLAAAMAWVATAGAWVVTCTEPARSLPPTGGGNALLVWVGWAAGPFATLVVGSVAWERVRGRGGPGDRPASAHTLEPAPGVPQEHFRCTRRSLVWRAVAVLVLGGLWAAVMAQWPGAVLRVLDGELDGLGRYDLAFGLIAGPLLLVLVIAAMAGGHEAPLDAPTGNRPLPARHLGAHARVRRGLRGPGPGGRPAAAPPGTPPEQLVAGGPRRRPGGDHRHLQREALHHLR